MALAYRIARRVIVRAVPRLLRDRFFLLLLVVGIALAVAVGYNATVSQNVVESEGPPDYAEMYMRAMRDHDADAYWESLAPERQAELERQFGTRGRDAVRAFFREQEAAGQRMISYREIARADARQGGSFRFYVATISNGREQRDIPFLLTLDPNGRVLQID